MRKELLIKNQIGELERVNQFREPSSVIIVFVLRLREVFHGTLQSILLALGVTSQGDHVRIEPQHILTQRLIDKDWLKGGTEQM